MERLTKRVDGIAVLESWAVDKDPVSVVQRLCSALAAYEDTGLEPGDLQSSVNIDYVRIIELLKADKCGRLVVLPFVPHSTMLNLSDPENTELMKDVCLYVAWKSSSGIVFHSPYNCFWQNIEKGYIKPASEEAEAALDGKDNTAPDAPEEPAEPEWKSRVMRTFLGGR